MTLDSGHWQLLISAYETKETPLKNITPSGLWPQGPGAWGVGPEAGGGPRAQGLGPRGLEALGRLGTWVGLKPRPFG